MNILGRGARFSTPRLGKQSLVSLLSVVLLFVVLASTAVGVAGSKRPGPARRPLTRNRVPSRYNSWSRRLPFIRIRWWPGSLAASTFPEQVVEADRWVQAHPDLKGADLGTAVDQRPWDPSVKALAAFPSVPSEIYATTFPGLRL